MWDVKELTHCSERVGDVVPGVLVYLSWGEGLLRARSKWRHAVAVTLPIIGESNNIK